MFFAPPQVKSLSRYSGFGVYLQPKHFLAMLALAILIHAVVIAIYSMVPREEVIRIPVRVLNIKLGGGGGSVVEMPAPAPVVRDNKEGVLPVREAPAKPAAKADTKHIDTKAAQSVMDNAISKHVSHSRLSHPVKGNEDRTLNLAAEGTLSTPKQYVRVGNLAGKGTGKGKGNGRSIAGTAEGNEIIQRYEQTISLWMAQHKTYPEAAKQRGIEGDAIVRIRINREGRILYNTIDRSSGNPLIDEAVLTMVRASDPVPVVPDDYPDGSQLEFLIPVSFRLQ